VHGAKWRNRHCFLTSEREKVWRKFQNGNTLLVGAAEENGGESESIFFGKGLKKRKKIKTRRF
jgi:hypothetical protein